MLQNSSYSLVDSMEQMGREKKPLIAGQCTGTLSYAVPCSKGNIYQLVKKNVQNREAPHGAINQVLRGIRGVVLGWPWFARRQKIE